MIQAVRRYREKATEPVKPVEDWKRVNVVRLVLWVLFWGAAVVLVGHNVMQQPLSLLLAAVALAFLFVLVNGISQGISDWNPLSSAFVVTVFMLVSLGLNNPSIGLLS